MSWSEVAAALTAASVTGGASASGGGFTAGTPVTGSAVNWEVTRAVHAMQVTLSAVTAGATGSYILVDLEGSLDGANWFQLATVSLSAPGTVEVVSTGVQPAQYVQATATGYTNGYGGGSQPPPISATVGVSVTSL